MNKNYIKKALYLWADEHVNDKIFINISDLPPKTYEHDRWLSDDCKITFDCVLSRHEFINLFGLSQSDVDRLLNDEVYVVSFDSLGSIYEPPTAVSNTVYIDGVSINKDPSTKIYYDKNEHKNSIDDEYNLKSCI